MPFINVKMAGPEPTKEQKLVEEMTDTMVRVLGKNRERVQIYIETYDASSIGSGGKTLEEIRKEQK